MVFDGILGTSLLQCGDIALSLLHAHILVYYLLLGPEAQRVNTHAVQRGNQRSIIAIINGSYAH